MGYFTCKTVQVSLSVVNGRGASDFSPEIELTVHGGKISIHRQCVVDCCYYYIVCVLIDNFRMTSFVEDLRPGFLGHSIMTFTWNRLHDREFV